VQVLETCINLSWKVQMLDPHIIAVEAKVMETVQRQLWTGELLALQQQHNCNFSWGAVRLIVLVLEQYMQNGLKRINANAKSLKPPPSTFPTYSHLVVKTSPILKRLRHQLGSQPETLSSIFSKEPLQDVDVKRKRSSRT
jgi:hypothetical protein